MIMRCCSNGLTLGRVDETRGSEGELRGADLVQLRGEEA